MLVNFAYKLSLNFYFIGSYYTCLSSHSSYIHNTLNRNPILFTHALDIHYIFKLILERYFYKCTTLCTCYNYVMLATHISYFVFIMLF